MTDNVKIYLSKAEEDILDAEILFEKGRYTTVVSRSYYAMFHGAQALLLSKLIETYTHSGVNIQFHKLFIKTGIFSLELGKSFTKILDTRIKSDYEIGFKASKDVAETSLREAREFLSTIRAYLDKK